MLPPTLFHPPLFHVHVLGVRELLLLLLLWWRRLLMVLVVLLVVVWVGVVAAVIWRRHVGCCAPGGLWHRD